jgi:organic hydroperoxide reductase OsmC/OhrA
MTDILIESTSEEGYATTSIVGDFELSVDAGEEEGPGPNGTLVATYASCFIPAFRVGAQQRDHDDVGRIEITSEADLDDDDDLTAIRFTIKVEADLGDDVDDIVERAEDICHVHSALREELRAEITVEDDAF